MPHYPHSSSSLPRIAAVLVLLGALTGCIDFGPSAPPAWPTSVTAVVAIPAEVLTPSEEKPSGGKSTPAVGAKPTRTPRPKRTATPTETPFADAATGTPDSAITPSAPGGFLETVPPDAKFDFFVLALSWSPEYCATNAKEDPQQCTIDRNPGFVLHGLWPQYISGYPSNCSTQKMPAKVKAKFPHLYPSSSLMDHEWSKHGTCSGLSPEGYLSLSQAIKESVAIPAEYLAPDKPFRVTIDQLRQAFAQANPGMDSADVEVSCSGSGRFLEEIYVCFSKDGQPTACSKQMQREAQKSCGRADFLVQSAQ